MNRARAAALGVTAAEIENALYDAYGSRQVSTIYAPQNEYWVITELLPKYQQDPVAMGYLYVQSATGQLLPLSSVARITKGVGPVAVAHSGQLPSVTVSFNLRPGVALGTATAEVQRIATQSLPSGITTSFQGTAQAFQSTEAGLVALVILAIFVIYVVLGVLYESFIHPLTILSGLPFAAFGALLALFICRIELSIYAFVGIILLIGIVKKNAIMMIDFALEAERNEKMAPADAIVHAAHIRFRPIMMTTVAALAGAFPVALASGAGAETRRPLGAGAWSAESGMFSGTDHAVRDTGFLYVHGQCEPVARGALRKGRRADGGTSGPARACECAGVSRGAVSLPFVPCLSAEGADQRARHATPCPNRYAGISSLA